MTLPLSPTIRLYALGTFVLIAIILAAFLSARRAWADLLLSRAVEPSQIAAACELTPGDAACLTAIARRTEELGGDAGPQWKRAIAANPRSATALTQAALSAEVGGNLVEAERLLTQAARNNQQWLPRWSRANFYLRQNRMDEFWPALRLALERSWGDRTAIFRLARMAGATTPFLLDRILPDSNILRESYLRFLIRDNLAPDIPAVAARVLDRNSQIENGLLVAACEALVQAHRASDALALWNRLAREGRIPYAAWTPLSPVANPGFRTPFLAGAFDWRVPTLAGIDMLPGATPGGAKIFFSGRQPATAELLLTVVYLPGSKRYRLAFDAQTRGIATGSGPRWRVWDWLRPPAQLAVSQPLYGTDWHHVELPLDAAPSDTLLRLVLAAESVAGRLRPEGEVWIRNVRLEPLP